MAGAEPKPPSADEITTNLKLQKIKDTDYAGNFPTIYNNNLDLIDVLNNKQDKLIAGSGITIASDGKTISSSGKEWKISNKSITDLFSYNKTTKVLTFSHCKILFFSNSTTSYKLVEVPDLKINFTGGSSRYNPIQENYPFNIVLQFPIVSNNDLLPNDFLLDIVSNRYSGKSEIDNRQLFSNEINSSIEYKFIIYELD